MKHTVFPAFLHISLPQPPKLCAALARCMCFCGLVRWWWRRRAPWLVWWSAGTLRCERPPSGSIGCTPTLRSVNESQCKSLLLKVMSPCWIMSHYFIKTTKYYKTSSCGFTYLYTQATKAENTPHYKVLFSGPGPSSVVIGYLPQTQLQRISGIRVCLKKTKQTTLHE